MHVIAHGVDLVEIPRIQAMLLQHGKRFTGRCFTAAEQAYAETGQRMRAQRYAARFACKEAVLKALGTGWREGISWRDVEVRHNALGQPQIALSGRCAEVASRLGIDRWHVSLSHTPAHAIASVIACGRVSLGDEGS